MAEVLDPPFKKGQKVYKASANHTERKVPCSDCGGKKTITYLADDPVEEVVVDCPVCRSGWEVRGYLTYWDVEPEVKELEVKGYRYDSTDENAPWTYIMVGYWNNGGGTLFSSEDLFDNYDDALARAKELADKRRAQREDEIIKQKNLQRKDLRRREEDGLRLSMTAQIRRMREALEFYADPESHDRRTDAVTPVAADGGYIARKVLEQNGLAPVRRN